MSDSWLTLAVRVSICAIAASKEEIERARLASFCSNQVLTMPTVDIELVADVGESVKGVFKRVDGVGVEGALIREEFGLDAFGGRFWDDRDRFFSEKAGGLHADLIGGVDVDVGVDLEGELVEVEASQLVGGLRIPGMIDFVDGSHFSDGFAGKEDACSDGDLVDVGERGSGWFAFHRRWTVLKTSRGR